MFLCFGLTSLGALQRRWATRPRIKNTKMQSFRTHDFIFSMTPFPPQIPPGVFGDTGQAGQRRLGFPH